MEKTDRRNWRVDPDDKLNPHRAFGIVSDWDDGGEKGTAVVAEVTCDDGSGAAEVDAYLMAAAPRFLEATQNFLAYWQHSVLQPALSHHPAILEDMKDFENQFQAAIDAATPPKPGEEDLSHLERQAFAQGVADRLSQETVTWGRTYVDASVSEAYDRGLNLGERLPKMTQACESVGAYVEGTADEDIASDAEELTRCLRMLASKCHAALNDEPDEDKAKQRRVAIYRLPSGTASKGDFVGVYHGPVFEFSTPIHYEHNQFGASSVIELQDQHYTAMKIDGRFWTLRRAAVADLAGASHEVTIYPNTELDIDLVETPAKKEEKSPVEELVQETQQVLDDFAAEENFQGRASISLGRRTRLTELLNRVRKTL